jgi:type II secretory pathway pseudopilin PulG
MDANGMPTDHSTPAEQAETAQINNQVKANNAAADQQADANAATYQAQQQQYQTQLQQNQVQQQEYQDRTAAYQGLRERYAAERAAYHRDVWPDRYSKWVIVERDAKLIGERVELVSGSRVGTVIDTAHAPGGHVTALLVRLDNDKVVWIDAPDIRYNRADGVVMTNLDAADLHHMADERI